MLITNFSSGELSNTLFGRIDMQQYYQGAARLENFDVIPTGGIKRRPGLERLQGMNTEGRIIPFIVDRDKSFLLYLTSGLTYIYRIINRETYLTGHYNTPYEELHVITEVQYSQDFNTMILCHEKYFPLEVKYDGNNLEIKKLQLSFEVPIAAGLNITNTDINNHRKNDEQYNSGWLQLVNNYPAAVSFFNGRLVFAGTKNNRQRIFASAIKLQDRPYNFATKKIFLTERKEYIAIYGTIDLTNKRNIHLETSDAIRFTSRLENYFFDSPFFADGTKIASLQGGILTATTDALIDSNSNVVRIYIPLYTRHIIVDEYPTADCGFTFEIASDMNDAIRWLAMNKNLLVGTESAEWIIPAEVNGSNVQAVLNSRYGSDKIQATAIGDAMCFFKTGRKGLIEYYIPQADNNFRANNMVQLSPQMLQESKAKEFDFVMTPCTRLFIVREDGVMITLLYDRNTGTYAWNRITAGENGNIVSAAVIPGPDGFGDTYIIIKRNKKCYLERLPEEGTVYLDSYKKWLGEFEGYNDKAVIYDEKRNVTYQVKIIKIQPKLKIGTFLIGQLTSEAPPPADNDNPYWIGFLFTSTIRSMPVIANTQKAPNNIKNLNVRFFDSFMPVIKALPGGKEEQINRKEPNSGVEHIHFPGGWNRDVQFEISHNKPTRCSVLAIYAEVE